MWLVIHNRIPTRDRLIQRGLQVDNRCLLCNRNQETIDHLFFSCDFSYDLWKLVARRLEILPNKNWADYTRTNNFPLIADTAKTTCPSYLAGDGILDLEWEKHKTPCEHFSFSWPYLQADRSPTHEQNPEIQRLQSQLIFIDDAKLDSFWMIVIDIDYSALP